MSKNMNKEVKSIFQGNGRILGSGAIVTSNSDNKKCQETTRKIHGIDDDDDYIPDEPSYSDEFREAQEDTDEDMDYVEIEQANGSYTKVKRVTQGDEVNFEAMVKSDKKFVVNSKRGLYRLAVVITRYGEEDEKSATASKEYDFSDASNDHAPSKAVEFVECKVGTYRQIASKSKHARFKQYKEEELWAMDRNSRDGSPCSCHLCYPAEEWI